MNMLNVSTKVVENMNNNEIINGLWETLDACSSKEELNTICELYIESGAEPGDVINSLKQIRAQYQLDMYAEQLVVETVANLCKWNLPVRMLNS